MIAEPLRMVGMWWMVDLARLMKKDLCTIWMEGKGNGV